MKTTKAPDWDKPYEPQTKWGELASSISDTLSLIEQGAKVFRKNKPKSKKAIFLVEQSTGFLEIKIRGGVNTPAMRWPKTILTVGLPGIS